MTPWPTSIGILDARFDLNENIASFESSFTRQLTTVTLSGGTADRWEGVLSTPTLTAAQVQTMWAFLTTVGLFGQFTVEDPDYTGPASGESNGLVMGASQSGTSLVCDGFSNNTLILSAGEWFQVGNEMKLVTADATSNGSGEVTFNFKPALRVSPANNDAVILNSPVFLLRLTSIPSRSTDGLKMGEFVVSFEEAVLGV